eukprot:sb/3472148/
MSLNRGPTVYTNSDIRNPESIEQYFLPSTQERESSSESSGTSDEPDYVMSREEFYRLQAEMAEQGAHLYSKKFKDQWGMPHCCGAIDGKHCKVNKFDNAGSTLYNYKKFHSVVLLAVVDANYSDTGHLGGRLLSTKSGCPLNRGQIRLISYIGEKIMSLKRGGTKSGDPNS